MNLNLQSHSYRAITNFIVFSIKHQFPSFKTKHALGNLENIFLNVYVIRKHNFLQISYAKTRREVLVLTSSLIMNFV